MVRTWNDLSMEMKETEDKRAFVSFLRASIPCENYLYSFGSRHESIRHTQMRVGFSPLNCHLFRHGLTDHESCACGYEVEDLVHYFFNCPLYTEQRRELISFFVGLDIDITVDIIQAGSEQLTFSQNKILFKAVHTYIKNTGRFN